MKFRGSLLAAVAMVAIGVASAAPPAAVTRCGWFVNPTPANAWLVDRDAEWTIGTQGGPQADGDWPSFLASRWVATNGGYGHGCACLGVVADRATRTVKTIVSAHSRPLSTRAARIRR